MRVGEYLSEKLYIGRAIIAGSMEDGKPVLAYILTGRSHESQNRHIVKDLNELRVESFDEKAMDILREYPMSISIPMRRIIGNGSHTLEIAEKVDAGHTFIEALGDIYPEPDKYKTPRIALLYNLEDSSYSMGIVREGEKAVWNYKRMNGYSHIIQTYNGDGDLSSFDQDPVLLSLPKSLEELKEEIWSSLNREYRVSVYLSDGIDEIILNKREV